jgi:chromosome segregation ATPase
MWPKALAQLIELAPHIARLLPMADRFFQSKNAPDEAARGQVEAMAESLREDLAKIGAVNQSLYRQLNQQSQRFSDIAELARAAKEAADSAELRAAAMEKRLIATNRLMLGMMALMVVLLALVIVLLVRR